MPYRDERAGLSVVAFMLMFAVVGFVLRGDFWMTVEKMDVQDAIEGEPILIDYERTIRRPFTADWRVQVRRVTGDGLEWVCATPVAREDYDARSRLPRPVTLAWFAWTDPRCHNLTPGQYEISAAWEVNPDGLASILFRRTVRATDTFTIRPAK